MPSIGSGAAGESALEQFELEADTLRVLANPKRLMIMNLIGDGARTVTEIAEALQIPLPNVSQHLRVMRDRRIVRANRSGKTVLYELTSPMFARCCSIVREVIVAEARRSERGLRATPYPAHKAVRGRVAVEA